MHDAIKAFIIVGLLVIACVLVIEYLSSVMEQNIKTIHDTESKYNCKQLEEIKNNDHFSDGIQDEAERQYLSRCL